jgi:hypothetical protein
MRKGKQLVICPSCGNAFPIETIVDHVSTHSVKGVQQIKEREVGSISA